MARYARIANGVVAEIIDLAGMAPGDTFHPDVAATLVAVGTGVNVGDVRSGQTFAPAPPLPGPTSEAVIAAIKAEAGRRILSRFPAHQQSNALAMGLNAAIDHGPDPASWPPDLQAELTRMRVLWDWTRAVRARSDALEASPPTDISNDSHWPVAPAKDQT
jgi:hypothetical protein